MSIEKKKFGKTKDGKEVTKYILKNKNGMEAHFIDYGATLNRLYVPDAKGVIKDVVLGFDDVAGYEACDTYYGAFIGRVGNRISNGKFVLNGKEYTLDKNNGENSLHGGFEGYDSKIYEAECMEEEGDVSIEFSRLSPDMEQGFPGNLDITVTYTLTEDNALVIEYFAVSDQDTLFNPTNHSYFNLAGHDSGNVLSQKLKIQADAFAEIRDGLIPTGKFIKVADTPLDFTEWKSIGKDIDEKYEALEIAGGYDHHFEFNTPEDGVRLVAEAVDEESGRYMEVFTDMPGMQLYTGNFISGDLKGKEGYVYKKHAGFCMETQVIPDSINLEGTKQYILKAGKEFDSTTVYKFGTK